jgi:hypothetical protein
LQGRFPGLLRIFQHGLEVSLPDILSKPDVMRHLADGPRLPSRLRIKLSLLQSVDLSQQDGTLVLKPLNGSREFVLIAH